MSKEQAPTATQIDCLAAEYLQQKQRVEVAQEKLKPLGENLKELCEEYGTPHAKASKLLLGNHYEVVRSQGDSVDVDQGKVALLWNLMKHLRAPTLFSKLFTTRVVFVVADGAHELLSQKKLPPKSPANLRALFHQAVTIDKASPRLKVEPRKKDA